MRARSLKGGDSLDTLVVALCHDYARRAEMIRRGSPSPRTKAEMEYLNYRIFKASAELAGDELAELYISEIGGSVGYAHSADLDVGECGYKRRKQGIKENIARKLYLSD